MSREIVASRAGFGPLASCNGEAQALTSREINRLPESVGILAGPGGPASCPAFTRSVIDGESRRL